MNYIRTENHIWHLIKSLIHSSELKYKNGDFKGAVADKKQANRLFLSNLNIIGIEDQFYALLKDSVMGNPKYDLIQDYKVRIDAPKRAEIISRLEALAESKYEAEDYKGAIRAMRRADKYR